MIRGRETGVSTSRRHLEAQNRQLGILKMARAGVRYAEIAAAFNVSNRYVHQVARKAGIIPPTGRIV